jgi:hypothetical protein
VVEMKLLPIMLTSVPTTADLGLKSEITGGFAPPAITVNASCKDCRWRPVWTVTVRNPTVADGSILSWAVAVVGAVTVTGPNPPSDPEPTEIPGPKLACVKFCTKFVKGAPMVTERVCPTCPELGVTAEMMPGGFTVKAAAYPLEKAVPSDVVPAMITL